MKRYYRKRGSASYCALGALGERERERERERRGSDVTIVALKLAPAAAAAAAAAFPPGSMLPDAC